MRREIPAYAGMTVKGGNDGEGGRFPLSLEMTWPGENVETGR